MNKEVIIATIQGEEHLGDNLKKQCIDYINNLEKENERLKQWDNNKDSRNSRQRTQNKKLLEKNKHLQNNWNELKMYLEVLKAGFVPIRQYYSELVLSKMQELERGKE